MKYRLRPMTAEQREALIGPVHRRSRRSVDHALTAEERHALQHRLITVNPKDPRHINRTNAPS